MLELLRQGLTEHGFSVITAPDGVIGLEIALSYEFDIVVLDIGLPRLNGFGLIQAYRARGRLTPVLILTARDTPDDIIRGLDLGADDYLTKPFSFAELVARLHSIVRPQRSRSNDTIKAGDVVIDLVRHTATRNNQSIDLTRHEFLLLSRLLQSAGSCVPRKTLIDSVWGGNRVVAAGTLDVLMNSLRGKIDTPHDKKLINTVRGSGYLFAQDESEAAGSST